MASTQPASTELTKAPSATQRSSMRSSIRLSMIRTETWQAVAPEAVGIRAVAQVAAASSEGFSAESSSVVAAIRAEAILVAVAIQAGAVAVDIQVAPVMERVARNTSAATLTCMIWQE